MKEKTYTRISFKERIVIETLLRQGLTLSKIAKELKRDRSSIGREVKRGSSENGWGYKSDQAQFKTDFHKNTKRIDRKLDENPELLAYVKDRMGIGWSPEQISERIGIEYADRADMRISYESIYKYIYALPHTRERGFLIGLLPYKKAKRGKTPRRNGYKGKIQDRVPIGDRPGSVEGRKEPGHWEGDLIVGKGHKSAIGTLVERTTRYTIIVPLGSMKSVHVVEAFAARLNALGWGQDKSLTYDNGVEMASHKLFTELTGLPVFFADPYSSWQRGTNENTNGLIRRVFKKGTDFGQVSDEGLAEMEKLLNDRPRKVLGWKTPREMLQKMAA